MSTLYGREKGVGETCSADLTLLCTRLPRSTHVEFCCTQKAPCCPSNTWRRVRSARGEGRDVSGQYGERDETVFSANSVVLRSVQTTEHLCVPEISFDVNSPPASSPTCAPRASVTDNGN